MSWAIFLSCSMPGSQKGRRYSSILCRRYSPFWARSYRSWLVPESADFSSVMLPLAAGGFIYIAGSDLVPELNKESTSWKSLVQIVAIGLGVGLMLVLDMLED